MACYEHLIRKGMTHLWLEEMAFSNFVGDFKKKT